MYMYMHIYMYIYIYMHVCVYIYMYIATIRNPVPEDPRQQASVTFKGMRRGACYIPFVAVCRAASDD